MPAVWADTMSNILNETFISKTFVVPQYEKIDVLVRMASAVYHLQFYICLTAPKRPEILENRNLNFLCKCPALWTRQQHARLSRSGPRFDPRFGQVSWVRFFRGISSSVRQMSGSVRASNVPEYHLAIIIINHHSLWALMTRDVKSVVKPKFTITTATWLKSNCVHRCGPGVSMCACDAAGQGSIPGRDKFPGWGFFGVFLTYTTNVGKF